jgi:hypothetical protein
MFYVRDGETNGKFYMEVPRPGEPGEYDYVPADPALAFKELPNGKFMAVRDLEEAQRQAEGSSHQRYFESLRQSDDPKKVRQSLKRVDALQRQLEQLVIDRVSPSGVPHVEIIKDNQFMDLRAQYEAAVREGRQRESPFQPLTTYARKLITSSGKVIRPLLAGEVGMRGSTILCLEPGYGQGDRVSVPKEYGDEHGSGHGVGGSDDGSSDVQSPNGAEPVGGDVLGGDSSPAGS